MLSITKEGTKKSSVFFIRLFSREREIEVSASKFFVHVRHLNAVFCETLYRRFDSDILLFRLFFSALKFFSIKRALC